MHAELSAPSIHPANGSVHVVERSALAHTPAWRDGYANRRKNLRFYQIVEETLTQSFRHGYFVLRDAGGSDVAVQPFFKLDQDLLEGASPVVRWIARQIRRLIPRFMFMWTLMIGCAAGEGHLDADGEERAAWIVASLEPELARCGRRMRARLIVFKEFPARYRPAMRSLVSAGYTRVPSFPMTRLKLDYADFEEFLAKGLSKSARRNYRRKFKAADNAPPLDLTVVNDITPFVDEAYPLYLAVFDRSRLHFEKLTKPFLCRLGAQMPDTVRFFIWRQQGKIVAFSLCMLEGDTLYDEYLGLDYSVALDLHLYFLTLRDILTWSIDHGYKWYCSSSLGYDPKLHLGCELVPLDLYVTHTFKPVNFVLRHVLPLLEPTHGDKTLKKFRNFHALRDDA